MKKRFLLILILALIVVFTSFAADADNWYYNAQIAEFSYTGLKNINEAEISSALYEFRYKTFSDELFSDIQEKLYNISGIDFFTAEAEHIDGSNDLRIAFEFYEIPMISSVSFNGNEVVKNKELKDAVTTLQVGAFIDPSSKAVIEAAKQEIVSLYLSKGFQEVPVSYEITEDSESNTYSIVFNLTEGYQTRIVSILFSGNENIDNATLRKQVSSKVKSLFNNGFLDTDQLRKDAQSIASYYQTNGYIDVIIDEPIIEYVESSNEKFKEVNVIFQIYEGQKWYYGGMEVTGNTIFTDAEIAAVQSLRVGDILNLESVQADYSAIADLYYNQGYISNGIDIRDERKDTDMSVKFYMDITEGSQARIQEILLTGLEKTKDYVMRRELELKPGDLFSKEKLITSAQNLYNTGLLSNLDYDLMYGDDENNVILDFKLEEGSTKDIQFGATFGGTLNGFPVSGFVQWADHNLGGRGQELNVSSTISPDTQSLSLSFGDSWYKDYRWSNSFSFSVSHTQYDGELQLGEGAKERYDGRNEGKTWPLGYSSAEQWQSTGNEYPSINNLMSYDLYTFSVGYSTGYTFIFTPGRLTLSGGLSFSLNKAIYDSKYDPYERLIYKYGLRWQFSNRLSLGIQWDGRDYITNTTKGYVLSASATYAGGILGGLSNYIKLSTSAAGYLKLFTVNLKDEKPKNIMLCASTSASFMLPQYYYDGEDGGFKLRDPKLGATKYEMLYIDGMTIGRGFNAVVDQSFLWDNMLEISYPLVENVVQAEAFVSATGVTSTLPIKNNPNWYFAAGAGLKLKISGFPLGLYMVKNATLLNQADGSQAFNWIGGDFFHGKRDNSGMSLVLAISMSLI